MLIVGTEWLVEAAGCDAARLRDPARVRAVLERAVAELDLRVVGDASLHKFPGAGGVTGLVLLTESHLACHTYPEFEAATFNLYCCRARPRWAWEERLAEMLGAARVSVRAVERRVEVAAGVESADVLKLEVGGVSLEENGASLESGVSVEESVVRLGEIETPAYATEFGGAAR
jgi:S-adenosylmethionine decarboxylase